MNFNRIEIALNPTDRLYYLKTSNSYFLNFSAYNNNPFISYYLRNKFKLETNNLTERNGIKEVLEEKGIKQTWLAEILSKSYNMVNGYVQNRPKPRLEILNEIANILDVDIKDLIVSNRS